MGSISISLEQLALAKLEKVGSRLSKSRRAILAILESTKNPITAEEISKKDTQLVQSSLYRNLKVLEDAGLVTRIVNENEFAFFELDEHVLGHHHHLRCISCGEVSDVELEDKIESVLESTSKTIAKKFRFTQVEHHLDFTGICKTCKNDRT